MTVPHIEFPPADEIKQRLERSAHESMTLPQINSVSTALSEQSLTPAAALIRVRRALSEAFNYDFSKDDHGLEILATSVAAGPGHGPSIKEASLPPRTGIASVEAQVSSAGHDNSSLS